MCKKECQQCSDNTHALRYYIKTDKSIDKNIYLGSIKDPEEYEKGSRGSRSGSKSGKDEDGDNDASYRNNSFSL